MNEPTGPVPPPSVDDHGELLVYRLWHPAPHTAGADTMRTFGPLFRFDPHPEQPPASGQPAVWYGGVAFETAVREVLDRTDDTRPPRVVEVCVRQRMAALRLAVPTRLGDLTDPARIGAADDLGDRSDVDYRSTRSWARALHRHRDLDGLRYHSARHRHPDGSRAGINVVVWNPARRPTVLSDVNATTGGAWRRLLTMLAAVNAAAVKVSTCHRC